MWKRRKGVKIYCALGIVRFVSRPGSCSSFARHLSCLLCRVVLVPPDISFACPSSSALPRGLYCLHAFPNTVSYHQSPSAPLVTYFVLLLSCLSKHICCGCWCCYKMCKLHNAAGGVVLELWCLVLRQENMNFIACFCYQVQRACALVTACKATGLSGQFLRTGIRLQKCSMSISLPWRLAFYLWLGIFPTNLSHLLRHIFPGIFRKLPCLMTSFLLSWG